MSSDSKRSLDMSRPTTRQPGRPTKCAVIVVQASRLHFFDGRGIVQAGRLRHKKPRF